MKMICTGGPHGDACSSYDVILEHEYTVEEFMQEVLREKPDEWGEVTITTNLKYIYQNKTDSCEYKHGKVTADFKKTKTKSRIVTEIKANGGWTYMAYFIKCK